MYGKKIITKAHPHVRSQQLCKDLGIFPADSTVFFSSDVGLNPSGPLHLLPTETHPEGFRATTNLLQPTSKNEIVIKSVASMHGKDSGSGSGSGRGRRIRVVGSGHSWSKIAKSDDIQLSLENYKVC